MKRYYREDDGAIYDRKTRRYIVPQTERLRGDRYWINEGKEDEVIIERDEIEERR